MLVSVIVPVYNAEKYIERCVLSLVNQTYHNLEIILVDDGSTDKSGEKCESFKSNYSNITVVHQLNGGHSQARNVGLDIQNGDYVMFVDADDYIPANAIETMLNLAISQHADIVLGTCNQEEIEKEQEMVVLNSSQIGQFCISQWRYSKENTIPVFTQYINPGSQCMKLIHQSCFRGKEVRFNIDIKTHHEDTLFSMNLYNVSNKVILINKCVYYYDINVPNSVRKKLNKSKKEEVALLIREMFKIIGQYKMDDYKKKQLKNDFGIEMIYECWSEYFTHKENHMSIARRKKELSDFLEKKEINSILIEYNHNTLDLLPLYQKMILGGMKGNHISCLAYISYLWSLKKQIRG